MPDSAGGSPGAASGFARVMQQAGPYLAASWTLTAGVLIGALGGSWLDKKLGSSPWLVLIGTFLGVAIGLYQLAVVALKPGRGTK